MSLEGDLRRKGIEIEDGKSPRFPDGITLPDAGGTDVDLATALDTLTDADTAMDTRMDTAEGDIDDLESAVSALQVGPIVHSAPLVASDTAAGVFSWHNTTGKNVLMTRFILIIGTKASAECTLDAGVAATNISSDTVMDGVDVGTAAVILDSVVAADSVAKSLVIPNGQYFTVSKATGATAGLAGYGILEYVKHV